jgi:hypothetical protein
VQNATGSEERKCIPDKRGMSTEDQDTAPHDARKFLPVATVRLDQRSEHERKRRVLEEVAVDALRSRSKRADRGAVGQRAHRAEKDLVRGEVALCRRGGLAVAEERARADAGEADAYGEHAVQERQG